MQNEERRLYEKITFAVSILIALIQSFGMALTFGKSGMLIEYKWYWIISTTAIWTMTSVLLSYVGKKMGEKPEYFLGNGISLILASNILSSFPSDFVSVWEKHFAGKSVKAALLSGGIVLAVTAVILILTIFSQETKKDISVFYAVKVNTSGKEKEESVIPIIFASSILTFPVMIGTFLGKEDYIIFKLLNSSNWFQAEHPAYTLGAVLYIVLIFTFSYFYLDITMNPIEIASRVRSNGGMVVGVRPGQDTADYLKKEMQGMVAGGAFLLSIIALIPAAVGGLFGLSNLSFLGTSFLIVAAVILETTKTYTVERKAEKYQKTKGGLL